MFIKPFKIKSNVRLRNTDRKRLRAQLEKQFPSLSPSQLDLVCPASGDLFQLRLLCHGGDSVTVYCLDAEPVFFEHAGDTLLPTVYTLWRLPTLLPHLSTWENVVERLAGGADLMAPGLTGCSERLSEARVGDPVAVRVAGRAAAVAVGRLLQSPQVLVANERRSGKAVAILHVLGDQLWVHGGKKPPPPRLSDASGEEDGEQGTGCGDAEEAGAEEQPEGADHPAEELPRGDKEEKEEEEEEEEEEAAPEEETTDSMDALLDSCVLSALRSKLPLPLLASSLYSGHVLPRCPPGRRLDIRRTSYKKLSAYLSHLQAEGVLTLKELSPGVQSIATVRREHLRLRSVAPMELPPPPEPTEDSAARYQFPAIRELRTVTAAVLPIFPGRNKGRALGLDEVRAAIRGYVKENELQDPEDKSLVCMDPRLSDAAACSSDRLSWEELFKRVMSRMQPAHEVTAVGGAPVVHRGALPPISFAVAQRTGNKKVTLIEGLEAYGIDPSRLAHEVQVGVAASVSVSPLANGKQQLLVQGNQVAFLERLLTGSSYGVPRKYLKGLEHAAAKKKGGGRK
ncbi:eukaryotic translation initiation factor 2D-like [Haemaphysalis longicornis]